jgi:hypothetical protein
MFGKWERPQCRDAADLYRGLPALHSRARTPNAQHSMSNAEGEAHLASSIQHPASGTQAIVASDAPQLSNIKYPTSLAIWTPGSSLAAVDPDVGDEVRRGDQQLGNRT